VPVAAAVVKAGAPWSAPALWRFWPERSDAAGFPFDSIRPPNPTTAPPPSKSARGLAQSKSENRIRLRFDKRGYILARIGA